jgi:NodT family efflux transporter outer membrane factor (OMF) lipoprotein
MTLSTGTGARPGCGRRRAALSGVAVAVAMGERPPRPRAARPGRSVRSAATLLLLAVTGCVKVGPDFVPPQAPMETTWLAAEDPRIVTTKPEDPAWWRRFNDPRLSNLIRIAQQQNPNVQIAGVRVLQARAQLAATVGNLYPQQQQLFGGLTYKRLSSGGSSTGVAHDVAKRLSLLSSNNSFWLTQLGVTASWELDFWGKFRRAIEASDANLMASISNYDEGLVSLIAQVASTYVNIRTYEERLRIARENAKSQQQTLNLAKVRFRNGEVSETDPQQATSEYAQTRSQIPQLQIGLRQNLHALSILLGRPPSNLDDLLGSGGSIPVAPPQVAIGIPADLLRRRPDIRAAEQQAAAQSATIGATKAELYPAFSLSGTFGFLSTDVGNSKLSDVFDWKSRVASFGPAVVWNVFNYGQITNQVRAQDAVFQQAILTYQNTVLQAQQEVEDGLASFLGAQDTVKLLSEAVAAAQRSADLAAAQYRAGATSYTTVLTAQQNLLAAQDQLAVTQGSVATGLISLYRALGGGWETREGKPFVPADIEEIMAKRTDWGGLLQQKPSVEDVAASPVPVPAF